jgi:hypothetical protein
LIYQAPSASFEATADWGTTGLTGTIGVQILDNVGGVTTARTTAGVTEIASGIYSATLTAPAAAGQYSVVWDDGTTYASDELTVTSSTSISTGITDAGMSFKDIVDFVLENRFRDTTTTRSRAERFVNDRYVRLVGLEDWAFRYKTAAVTVTNGSRSVTNLPSDLQAVLSMWDDQGGIKTFLEPRQFYDLFQADLTTGTPDYYSILNGSIFVAPTASGTSASWQILYRRKATYMVADTDVPIVPAEYRMVLVHGALADMLIDNQDPSWQDEEAMWEKGLENMRRDLLTDAEGQPDMWAADPSVMAW